MKRLKGFEEKPQGENGFSGKQKPGTGPFEEKPKKRSRNREYALVTGFFVLLFCSLIGYLVYFQVFLSEDFINSPYNTRQDSFADRVIRGDILSSDGQLLAHTNVYEDGYEERVYPYENIFAHVVGFDSNGKSGLESEANFHLLSSHDFFLNQIRNEVAGRKNQGDTVITSLNANLQSTAYYALGDRRGAIFAMEPRTGRIVAMVSKPDFDPNTILYNWEYLIADENDSSLLNRATDGAYPPGSVFKIVTALDYFRKNGSFDGYRFDCEGTITVDDHSIHCYEYAAHGEEDFYSAFANSCNCAFARIGLDLGAASLRKTAQDLLFNSKLPLPSYLPGMFTLDASSVTGLVMQTAIGQGDTLVSPAHMALIVSAIANDGKLMKPSLIDEIRSSQGETVRTFRPVEYAPLVTAREAQVLRELMEQVVTRGTAAALGGRGYTAAGKTGSAEYNEEGDSHSWFVGYCNTEDPELVVSVIIEGGGAGSDSAVPVAAQIFDAYYYG